MNSQTASLGGKYEFLLPEPLPVSEMSTSEARMPKDVKGPTTNKSAENGTTVLEKLIPRRGDGNEFI